MRFGMLLLAAAVVANAVELKPYEMVWRPGEGVLADLSFLLGAPAGKHGFVHVRNGHLAKGNGERLRIWGVNFSFVASLPAKEMAPHVAAHLSRFGINCVRVHHLDWRTPRGIIDSKYPDSRHLDPEMLDRLDFLIAHLKRRGIYTNLNLNVARAFQEADGVKDAAQLGYAKAITYFDPRIIELQKEYARALLTHKNPYTGKEYRNEPAIAMVEIVNENSMVESWVRGRLQGKGAGKGDTTWSDIPASYERDLTSRFNQWLASNLTAGDLKSLQAEVAGEIVPRLAPAQFKSASKLRFHTEAGFHMNLEDSFFQDMYRYLKSELAVQVPVVGTSIHAGGLTPYPLLSSTSKLDIVDAHTYWQHPSYLSDPATGRRTGFTIRNTPAVDEPARMPLMTLARVAVAGKPFMVSEVNHPYPNEYAAEGIPLLAAYGAFQDWDAVFWYSFSHQAAETWDKPSLPGHLDMRQDPLKMTQWAAGALTFLRGDVQAAEKTIERSFTPEQVRDSLLLGPEHQPFFSPGTNSVAPLLHGFRVGSMNNSSPEQSEPPFVSDTRQITWAQVGGNRGFVTVDTDRTQSLIGWLKIANGATRNIAAKLENPFGAVTLVSMDSAPIAKAKKLLLTVGTKSGNRGMVWDAKRITTTELGQPGMMIEPAEGSVVLHGINGKSVELVPLDGGGRAAGPAIAARKSAEGWEAVLTGTSTPWYLVRIAK